MLKGVADQVFKPLAILFNRSISEGVFPNLWKLDNVIPIYKKGAKSSVTNYRPVSLLSCCGKLLERIIFKHIDNFFLENNLLYKYQSGFLPKHSTTSNLLISTTTYANRLIINNFHAWFSVTFLKPLTEYGIKVFSLNSDKTVSKELF